MGFTAKQLQELRRDLDQRYVRTREVDGRELSFIGGWYAVSEANRIFGFDRWSRETIESRCVFNRENRGVFLAVYVAKVRITVSVGGATVVREGHGTGEGRGSTPGEVHDIALKGAETDATKRALATFGDPFGLSLYEHGKLAQPPRKDQSLAQKPAAPNLRSNARDDTTQIPRTSTFHGCEKDLAARDQPPNSLEPAPQSSPLVNMPIVPAVADLLPGKIDKSVLTIGEPKRLRNKAHLRYVGTQPCLICGRQPSDPHHLRFAQPRALGLKVSDEFTVPLCRGHHRQLHQAGNEVAWWDDLDVDALEIAKGLWDETHGRKALQDYQAPQPAKQRPHP
ncbi:MAG TPA: Rad52/Rad22 family DNA repair protein [Pirellulales bacterium]|jgi:hypothetical protein